MYQWGSGGAEEVAGLEVGGAREWDGLVAVGNEQYRFGEGVLTGKHFTM